MSLLPDLSGRVSREEIASSPQLWRALAGMLAFFAAATFLVAFVMPDIDRTRMLVFSAVVLVCALVVVSHRPPVNGSPWRHAVVALVYLAPAGAIYAFAPHGSAAVAAGMFVGPMIAVWITDRWEIVGHFAAASVVLFLPSISGVTDTATLVACIALVPSIWALGLSCVVLLEAAEEQGEELEVLVRRDPLTGAGNRRLLDERLAELLPSHGARHWPLTVLTLDLDGFKNLNDTIGHAAGDELLQAVAFELMDSARPADTVIRQGGDEFCVVLPNTNVDQAAVIASTVRDGLGRIDHFGSSLTAGIGLASFPADAVDPDELLRIADERMLADKSDRTSGDAGHLGSEAYTRPTLVPRPTHRASPVYRLLRGVSRERMGRNRIVWVAGAAMYLMLAVLGSFIWRIHPELANPEFPYVVAAGGVVGMVLVLIRPPRMGSALNHLVIACSYVVPFLIMLTCEPSGSIGAGATIFAGPFMSIRLTSHRQIVAHLVAASLLYLSLPLGGLADAPTTVAVILLVIAMWVLCGCCVLVLEAAEVQGGELQALIRRDPLTGAGNRRLLAERLGTAVAQHTRTLQPLAVVVFDLNGFKALNDTLGHTAGDELLQRVARVLLAQARPADTVVRQGGDEFCLVLPRTSLRQAASIAEELRAELRSVDCGGAPLTTGIGIATFPNDGTTADDLLAAADRRLFDDKPARASISLAAKGRSAELRETG